MPDLQPLVLPNLTTPEGRQAVPSLATRVREAGDTAAAAELLLAIEAVDGTAVWRDYEAQLAPVLLLALPLLPEARAIALVDRALLPLLESGAEAVRSRFHLLLTGIPLRSRDAFKRQVVEQLQQGTATLTTTPLQTSAGTGQLPTVGNWIKVYLAARSATPSPDGFLAAQPNAAHFSAPEQARVKALATVVQLLTAPSTTLEGLEDDVPVRQPSGTFGLLSGGRIRPAPRVAVDAGRSARLALHPEDEPEIVHHTGRLSEMRPAPALGETADLIATAVLGAQGIIFADPAFERRFRTALTAHLKGIRSSDETRLILTRPTEAGGLGFTADQAEAVLTAVAEEAVALTNPKALAALKARLTPPAPSVRPVEEAPVGPSPLPRPLPPPPKPLPNIQARPPSPGGLPYQAKPLPTRMVRPRPAQAERPFVADVRKSGATVRPRTMGPVEELKALTLEEFRSAGPTTIGIRKLHERFLTLAKESYGLRVQGILAWRQSPLYGLYLAIGQESMTGQRPITAVVAGRQQRGDPALTQDEFAAIADLNQTLRF